MGSTTTKGYPYPVGTDRVMDGDDAIKALAEAVEADAQFTHAVPVGQSVASATVTAVTWQAATENGCNLTKTSASVWTVTLAGLYVVSAAVATPTQTARAFVDLTVGTKTARGAFYADGRGTATLTMRCIVGDTIKVDVYIATAGSITAGTAGGFLSVARLGRSTGATAP